MAVIKKVKLPDGTSYDINDGRISGIDSTLSGTSTNPVQNSAIASEFVKVTYIGDTLEEADEIPDEPEEEYTIIIGGDGEMNVIEAITFNGTTAPITDKTAAITAPIENFYFVEGSSSAAGNSTSGSYLSVKWEGTISGVSAAYNGLKIAYRIATRTGVSGGGVVLSIDNGAHYYPVVIQANTMVTTHYPVGATVLMVFNSTQTATAYLTSGTKSTVTGCWQIMEYDSNTNTYQRVYVSSDNTEYPITARYSTTSGSSYYAEYGRYSDSVTLNPSTNTITASAFKVVSGTSSQFLKADGTLDSNTYALSSAIPTVPTISTSITTDASSDVKTASPKAVKTYVDNMCGNIETLLAALL